MSSVSQKKPLSRELNTLIFECLDAALFSLGGPAARTLTWHLQIRGFSFDKTNQIDLEGLNKELKQILGIEDNMVMVALYKKLSLHCKMGDVLHIELVRSSSIFEKVLKTVELLEKDMERS